MGSICSCPNKESGKLDGKHSGSATSATLGSPPSSDLHRRSYERRVSESTIMGAQLLGGTPQKQNCAVEASFATKHAEQQATFPKAPINTLDSSPMRDNGEQEARVIQPFVLVLWGGTKAGLNLLNFGLPVMAEWT